jgi:hypothetical protein
MLTNKTQFTTYVSTETDPHGFKMKTRTRGTCSCGREIAILYDDSACECGRYYNLYGQELIPPDQRDPHADGDDEY